MTHVTGHLDGGIFNVNSTLPAGYNPTSGFGDANRIYNNRAYALGDPSNPRNNLSFGNNSGTFNVPSTLPSTYTPFDPTDLNLPSSSGSNVDTIISDAMGTGGDYFKDLSFGEDSQGGFNYSGLLSGLLNAGIGSYASNQNIGAAENFGAQVMGMAGQLANQAATRGEFKPFTVTSDLATAATTPEGGFGVTLSPEQQALQNSLMSQASGAFGEIGVDRASREQQIYDRLQALSNPMVQRAQMKLDNSLFSQGRTGLRTDAYGGTPEQLALSKAIQEQQSADAVKAMGMVSDQRRADFDLGQGLMSAGYVPQQQTLDMLDLGRGVAQLPTNLQANVLASAANIQSKGLEGYIEAARLASAERVNRNKLLTNAATQGNTVGSNSLTDAFGNYIGGEVSGLLSEIFR